MKKVYYNKLIRDKIPKKIQNKGSSCETRELEQKEFEKELVKKVSEEADGLENSDSREKMISELADIIDVMEEMKRVKEITDHEIEEARKENYKKKGGFEKRLFLTWSSDDGYKSNERRYNNN